MFHDVSTPDLTDAILDRVQQRRSFLSRKTRRVVRIVQLCAAGIVVGTVAGIGYVHWSSPGTLCLTPEPAPLASVLDGVESGAVESAGSVRDSFRVVQQAEPARIIRLVDELASRPCQNAESGCAPCISSYFCQSSVPVEIHAWSDVRSFDPSTPPEPFPAYITGVTPPAATSQNAYETVSGSIVDIPAIVGGEDPASRAARRTVPQAPPHVGSAHFNLLEGLTPLIGVNDKDDNDLAR